MNTKDSLTPLHDAIIKSLKYLKPNDLVCFNIGNSSKILECDCQSQIIKWETLPERINHDPTSRESWGNIFPPADPGTINVPLPKLPPNQIKKFDKSILASTVFQILLDSFIIVVYIFCFSLIQSSVGGACHAYKSLIPLRGNLVEYPPLNYKF